VTAERDLKMTDETLRQLLARVHERLSTTKTIDPEAREMLATVMRDIDGALGNVAAGKVGTGSVSSVPVSPDARVAAAAPRLEAVAVQFEAEHPAIAQLLRQIGALLGQAGI
jgi:predicted component of type VI protein secretion system